MCFFFPFGLYNLLNYGKCYFMYIYFLIPRYFLEAAEAGINNEPE